MENDNTMAALAHWAGQLMLTDADPVRLVLQIGVMREHVTWKRGSCTVLVQWAQDRRQRGVE